METNNAVKALLLVIAVELGWIIARPFVLPERIDVSRVAGFALRVPEIPVTAHIREVDEPLKVEIEDQANPLKVEIEGQIEPVPVEIQRP